MSATFSFNNKWQSSSTGAVITLVSPATEKALGRAAVASPDDVAAAVAAARGAFDDGPWPRLTIQERAAILLRFADELERDIDAISELVDVGIPFGGVKQSGYGRELGPEGLDSYFETHTFYLDGEPFKRLS